MQTTLEAGYLLIGTELRTIDDQLKETGKIHAWQMTNCSDAIKQVETSVYGLEQRVQQRTTLDRSREL